MTSLEDHKRGGVLQVAYAQALALKEKEEKDKEKALEAVLLGAAMGGELPAGEWAQGETTEKNLSGDDDDMDDLTRDLPNSMAFNWEH